MDHVSPLDDIADKLVERISRQAPLVGFIWDIEYKESLVVGPHFTGIIWLRYADYYTGYNENPFNHISHLPIHIHNSERWRSPWENIRLYAERINLYSDKVNFCLITKSYHISFLISNFQDLELMIESDQIKFEQNEDDQVLLNKVRGTSYQRKEYSFNHIYKWIDINQELEDKKLLEIDF